MKYCNILQMDQENIKEILELAIPIEQMADGLFLQKGVGLTAALIYLGVRLNPTRSYRTQRDIADVCRITEVTLRNNYKLILNGLKIEKKHIEQGIYTIGDIVSGAYKNEKE